MKRDMDLAKKILNNIRESDTENIAIDPSKFNCDRLKLVYHVNMLVNAGFLACTLFFSFFTFPSRQTFTAKNCGK